MGDPVHLLQGAGVSPGRGRVGADVACHGWQVAFDGSLGLSPTSGEKVLSWGLILWTASEPPCMWAVIGGCVEPSASGENGSGRAELEALCVACQYHVCPPVMLPDESAAAFLDLQL